MHLNADSGHLTGGIFSHKPGHLMLVVLDLLLLLLLKLLLLQCRISLWIIGWYKVSVLLRLWSIELVDTWIWLHSTTRLHHIACHILLSSSSGWNLRMPRIHWLYILRDIGHSMPGGSVLHRCYYSSILNSLLKWLRMIRPHSVGHGRRIPASLSSHSHLRVGH